VDLEKFFDRVNHDVLMGLLQQRIVDARMLRLIRRYLNAGVLADGVVMDRHEGTPQGGPLSPLLANVLLDVIDKKLETRGHCFVRYADDCNIYVKSKRAGERVLETLTTLYTQLKLRINTEKSAVAPAKDRQFLGYSFWYAKGGQVKRRVSPKALTRLKAHLRELTSRNGGRSLASVVAALRSYLTGWKAYFRLADTPGVLTDVDQWLHRRLRMLMVKQCKRGPTLYRVLRARGLSRDSASAAAAHCKRWWAMAAHGALHTAFPRAYFISRGVPLLGPS
jgi:group II intron reverse transcriptase/maturase